jgi:transcriptional regulator with XRE-family HTH domain
MCKKMGLGQQALADAFDMKRGKVAGYFYETQPKPEFFEKLREKFDLDIGKFLSEEMGDANYSAFFVSGEDQENSQFDSSIGQKKKPNTLDILMELKRSSEKEDRDELIDHLILIHGRTLDEINHLKDNNSRLKDQLIEMMSKQKS